MVLNNLTIAKDPIHCISIYVINFKFSNHFIPKLVAFLNNTLRRSSFGLAMDLP